MRSKKEEVMRRADLSEMMERTTICVPGPEPGLVAHGGEEMLGKVIKEHYSVAESNAVEQLVVLKGRLRDASTYDFWSILMEEMTSITGAQYGFAAKRLVVEDQNLTVEMPAYGEEGSCLMGVAFYYNDGREMKNLHRDWQYIAYGSPCEHMRHDKVFLIPNGMPKFIPSNPNRLPFPAEAYLGIPLFADGRCFGHFGMMWSAEGVEELRLSWAYIEILLHALEDLIRDRLVGGQGYAPKVHTTDSARAESVKTVEKQRIVKVVPAEAVTASQSLKPYARSLSHELRTPMQGVVGMLDVMYATVQESLEGSKDATVRKVFKDLRENIEVVQDSSRRAVEAADNVVLAYDLNMQVPDTPVPPNDDESVDVSSNTSPNSRIPNPMLDSRSALFRRGKRPRTSESLERGLGPAVKQRHPRSPRSQTSRTASPHTRSLKVAVEESDDITNKMEGILGQAGSETQINPVTIQDEAAREVPETEEVVATPGLRHSKIRELLHLIIHESLRVGGRPESAVALDTDGGEIIEVRTRSPDGETQNKVIEWSVDPKIPETIFVDERDLAKLVSCIFLNAVKFTEEGKITLTATLSSKARYVVIKVADTGSGIPEAFQPYLFKAFSREDDSLTRQKEGLGLGLLVAKGLARKIGGELTCVRTNVEGPNRGSEFEMRVPLRTGDSGSRAATPSRTPSPGHRSSRDFQSPTRARHDSSADLYSQPHSPRTSTFTTTQAPETPIKDSSPPRRKSLSPPKSTPILPPTLRRPSTKQTPKFDRRLAEKYPLSFLVAEDNTINRRLLVSMLARLGYTSVYEAHDGAEAVHQMHIDRAARGERPIDVILMDLWMPNMDGYEATERILQFEREKKEQELQGQGQSQYKHNDSITESPSSPYDYDHQKSSNGNTSNNGFSKRKVTVLAVTADVTDSALERASQVGMEGFMSKPYKLLDLERLILEYCIAGGAIVHV